MTPFERLNLASRAFCLAAILGLSLALSDAAVIRGPLVLAAIAAAAVAAELNTGVTRAWIAITEGGLAALMIGILLPDGLILLPYLVVPALLVGMGTGARAVTAVVAAESLGLALLLMTSAQVSQDTITSVLLPWLVTALGAGFLGSWLRQLRLGVRGLSGDSSYESARRLLTQLRTVARKLSSGLDPVSMSSQILAIAHQHLNDAVGAVFVLTEGEVLAPLAYRGPGAKELMTPEGPAVARCLRAAQWVQEPVASGHADRRNRIVLPLRAADRTIGVVICEASDQANQRALTQLLSVLDEQAIRLDTALTFDEVRSMATTEERRRLAREIHDGVAQEIASLGYIVDDLLAATTSDSHKRKLQALRGELTRIVSELRLSIFDLKSEVSGGLGSALSDYVREVGARSGLTVHLTLDEATTRLRPEVETELLRIAQEAVTNARKHSGAANLWVDCRIRPPYGRISVADDGRGLGKARADSYGLGIMRERADRVSARIEIKANTKSNGLQGTRVTVTVGDVAAGELTTGEEALR